MRSRTILAAIAGTLLLTGPADAQQAARPSAPSVASSPAAGGGRQTAQARPATGFERPAASGGASAPGVGRPPAPAQSSPPRAPGFEFTPAPGGRPPHHDHGVVVGYGTYWGWPYPGWGWPYPYWDYPYYPYFPYHPYYPYPYYTYGTPPVYLEQTRAGYWYYCASAREYYPKVATCPEPWIAVAPRPSAD
ncbi:MAG TPA: hypothetical protein VIE37_21245 [Methylomirabilota bacterium]|jgi:hypothetical protein